MNIKKLLAGATVCAPFLPFIDARAGDIPLPEPEPMEYVRVCDAYGKGYFFIPGTQTCLKIGGYVRSEIQGGDEVYTRTYGEKHRDTYAWMARGVIEFETASDTDWGTLKTYMNLRSDWQAGAEFGSANDSTGGSLRAGYIELGGLRVGLDETAFTAWVNDYGNVLNDDVLNGSASRTNLITYTFSSKNGFSAVLSLEQGNSFDGDGNPVYQGDLDQERTGPNKGGFRLRSDGLLHDRKLSQQIHNYAPYMVGGLKYTQNWGVLSGVFGYDTYYSEWAAKLRTDFNITDKASIFAMIGYKSMDDYYSIDKTYGKDGKRIIGYREDGSPIKRFGIFRQINSIYGDWGGDCAYWLGGTYKFNPKTSFNYQLAYSDERTFAASANFTHYLLPGLRITPELSYINWNNRYGEGWTSASGNKARTSLKGQEATQFLVQVQRSF